MKRNSQRLSQIESQSGDFGPGELPTEARMRKQYEMNVTKQVL